MDLKGSHPVPRIGSSQNDNLIVRPRMPLVPALLGTLAVMNVASVVLALMG